MLGASWWHIYWWYSWYIRFIQIIGLCVKFYWRVEIPAEICNGFAWIVRSASQCVGKSQRRRCRWRRIMAGKYTAASVVCFRFLVLWNSGRFFRRFLTRWWRHAGILTYTDTHLYFHFPCRTPFLTVWDWRIAQRCLCRRKMSVRPSVHLSVTRRLNFFKDRIATLF